MAKLPRGAVFVVLSVLFLALSWSSAFAAERRVALVIGNSKYQNSDLALANPATDAREIASVLKDLGFDVETKFDISAEDMDAALDSFEANAHFAQVALFFYAGHAFQYDMRASII
jgi:uncharacterized caspase-like protein